MKLKTIKLAGFKSFVDPTTVKLPSNLCAIVGPNGCGKSNTIDAVRWVLGEGSAKHLRGESMADVIFNGSTGRKPVGQASVELVFENAEGKLGGAWASYAEIAIRRMVTRDGLSQYFLNGTRCRRRDITDIFLGTGLGPRSYAIIEQGMISRLIEAKPEELRVYIEEAAGISRYKERRKDTENRIRRTRENLERLKDLREELERQLQHLKRQASAAERYGELRTEERRVRSELLALQWRELEQQGRSARELILQREVELAAVNAGHAHVDARIEELREEHNEFNEQLGRVQERYYAIGAEIARAEQAVQLQQERARGLQKDLEQTARAIAEAAAHQDSDRALLARHAADLAASAPALADAEAAERAAQQALAAAEQAMQAWQAEWDAFLPAAEKPRQESGVQQSRIRHLEESLAQAELSLERLAEEERTLDTSAIAVERAAIEQRVAETEEALAEIQARAEAVRGTIDARRETINQLASTLEGVRGTLQEHRGRQASLQALQQAALGQTDGVVTAWLRDNGIDGEARLARRVDVDAGWETALETVLGSHLQAVVVPDMNPLAAALAGFGEGTLDLFRPQPGGVGAVDAGRLLARVRASIDLADLLHGVHAVERLEEALALQPRLAAGESVVTRDGIWLGRDWLRVARDADPRAGVIQRERELAQLAEQIEIDREREAETRAALDDAREALHADEQELRQLQQSVIAANGRYTEARSALSGCAARYEQMLLRRERNQAQQAQYRERRQAQSEEVHAARALLEAALDAMHRDNQRREALQLQRDTLRSALDGVRGEARASKDAAHTLALRCQSLRSQIDGLEQAIARIATQLAQFGTRRDELAVQLAATEEPIARGREQLEAQLEQRLGVESELTGARQRVQAIEHALREAERERHAIEQQMQGVRDRLEQQRLAAQTVNVRLEAILEQLQRGSHDPVEILATLPPEAEEGAWQVQLDRIGNQILRLGPINLAAIEEHKAQSERKQYLDAQNADLEQALGTLENAIRKIDRETRSRFKETFDRINAGLQDLFPRVFSGGHAYLEMTGEDLLDTGVTIMARPPGKRNATIHLLSGGEKALTAIALVFAIFRLNPSPFCMLDEVDAPLDDANVGRYTRLVREMSEHVQFIVITHNKITMEMAHHLMGVTMQEPGVSRLVSVDVDEAVALAEA